MKIYFLFLCLITHVLYGSELYNLDFLTNINCRAFNPTEARRIMESPRFNNMYLDTYGRLNRCILDAEQALSKYEEAGCWGKPLYPYVGKTAYGMGALGFVLGATIVVTKGATNPWMLVSLPLLAPVVGRFCFYQYYVNQAKNLISFMKQTQIEMQKSRSQSKELHEQTEPSAAPSNKKKIESSCSIS